MGAIKDLLLRLLCLVALIWAALVGRDVHTEIQARQFRQPEAYPQYSDLLLALGYFAGMLVAQLFFRSLFKVVAREMIPKKTRWSYAVWGAKVTRCCDSVFKCSYYASMTTWSFAFLRKEPWMPTVLGGTGVTRFCWTDGYPFQVVSTELRRFYLTAVGFHLSEVAMLMLETKLPDFWEMLLHHTISCTLVSYSYVLNYVRLGSLILFMHGITDVFLYASKTVVDTAWTRLTVLSYVALITSYVWLRIIIFPTYLMQSAWVESLQEVGAEQLLGWGYLNFAMCLLFFLHMYWFGLIIKIGVHFRRTGQARDMISNLSSMDMVSGKKAL